MLINIDIVKKHPQVDGTPVIVCGNSGYTIRFNFDDEWDGLEYKTARFVYTKGGKPYHIDVPFVGDTVEAPALSGIGFVLIGVYTELLKTTTPARIPCEYSIRCNSGESVEELTPELYDQLLDLYNRVDSFQAAAIEAAKSASMDAKSAYTSATLAKESIKGVVSKVIEHNHNNYVTFWVGTSAEYAALEQKPVGCLCIITDDTTSADLLEEVRLAKSAAEDASLLAESAAGSANSANARAGTAASQAITAAEKAQQAANTAIVAMSDASKAKSDAATAVSTADQAVAQAGVAVQNANQALIYAEQTVLDVREAKATADQALSVANSPRPWHPWYDKRFSFDECVDSTTIYTQTNPSSIIVVTYCDAQRNTNTVTIDPNVGNKNRKLPDGVSSLLSIISNRTSDAGDAEIDCLISGSDGTGSLGLRFLRIVAYA